MYNHQQSSLLQQQLEEYLSLSKATKRLKEQGGSLMCVRT